MNTDGSGKTMTDCLRCGAETDVGRGETLLHDEADSSVTHLEGNLCDSCFWDIFRFIEGGA